MVINNNKPVYVTGVVIANGVPDSEGDCLDKKDIKKIFTKYLDRATDVMHTRIKNEGVEVLANWITETDTKLNGKIVPAGSWMVTFAITNEELLSSISDGSIGGISLGSVSEDAMTKKYWFINKSIHYEDLNDMEEVIPLFISFVDKGANQYGLEIMDYNVYINKNQKGEKMTNNEEPMIPISAIGKLKDVFSINKRETEKNEKEEKTDEKPAPSEDITNKELLEQIGDVVKKAFIEVIEEVTSKKEEDDKKEDENIDKKEDKNDEKEEDKKDDEKEDKDNDEKEEDKKDKKDVNINKRQTSMPENISDTTPKSDFYKMSGRDNLGRKIKQN